MFEAIMRRNKSDYISRCKYVVDELFDDVIHDIRYVIYQYKKDVNGRVINIDIDAYFDDKPSSTDEFYMVVIHNNSLHEHNTYYIVDGSIYEYNYCEPFGVFGIKRCKMPDGIAKFMNIISEL